MVAFISIMGSLVEESNGCGICVSNLMKSIFNVCLAGQNTFLVRTSHSRGTLCSPSKVSLILPSGQSNSTCVCVGKWINLW